MRHLLTRQFVLAASAVALFAVVFFAVWSNLVDREVDREAAILGLDVDLENGRLVYMEISQPACAACHSLSHAGAVSDRASDLDVMRPDARITVQSLIAGTVRAHDAQGYAEVLTDQEIADVSRYIEEVAGQ